ncbi:MAG: hypothetical protein GY716_12860 [bacterium]|nr:hypothetical protein [bacterium]
MRPNSWFAVVGSALVIVLLGPAAFGTTLLQQQELSELVAESRRAVLAEVANVRYAYDEHHLPSTYLTLRVNDALYGDLPASGETFEIKIYGAPVAMPDGLQLFISGTPHYRRGERYLFLLIEESRWGFTNTAGLPFGAFRVKSGAAGGLRAASVGGNRLTLGQDGLGRWLDLDELTSVERAEIADPTAAVPYTLLRRAVTDLWTAGPVLPQAAGTGGSR